MKILILSGNRHLYSTRRLIEAAQAKSHDVDVIDPANCYAGVESNTFSIYHNGSPIDKVDAVIPRIGTSMTFFGAAIVRQFEMMDVFTSVRSLALVRSRDKLRTLQILAKAGIGMPKTAFAFKPLDVNDLIKQIGGPPLILKLIEGTQGVGVVLAETKGAARSVIDALYALQAKIIAQEFIKESAGSDIRAFIVGGQVVAAMKRQGLDDEFRSNLHRGGTAVPIELTKEERSTAILAAKKLGLSIAGVDMLQSSRGPLVMEVNASPGLEGIETATGVNVAGRIIEWIEEKIKLRDDKDEVGA